MAKFKGVQDVPGQLLFFCPGCQMVHAVYTREYNNPGGPKWDFNDDRENPTVSPSLLIRYPKGDQGDDICHSFIRNGRIEFLGDCTHSLANQTVDLPDFDKSVGPGFNRKSKK